MGFLALIVRVLFFVVFLRLILYLGRRVASGLRTVGRREVRRQQQPRKRRIRIDASEIVDAKFKETEE